MPINILLLGAGFTRNWGGWLAFEVRNKLAVRVEGDYVLSFLINQHDNFVEALQKLQNEFNTSPNPNVAASQLRKFQAAIFEVFNVMNRSLANCQFEFCSDLNFSIATYLTMFDAIFTLNQDLLLEQHYLTPNSILTSSKTKKARIYLFGFQTPASLHLRRW